VITTEAAPADRRAAVAGRAELIVAGRESVDLRAAVDALTGRGYRQILTEGGPYLLSQIIEAGLLDELCLTLSPLLAGPGASRIVADTGPPRQPGGASARPLELAHVLADDGHLICRYVRPADG
jgi:riboflavin biosynthesis pyrimidine reductase